MQWRIEAMLKTSTDFPLLLPLEEKLLLRKAITSEYEAPAEGAAIAQPLQTVAGHVEHNLLPRVHAGVYWLCAPVSVERFFSTSATDTERLHSAHS